MTHQMLSAVRGAVTVDKNTPGAVTRELVALLQQLVAENNLDPSRMLSVFFTVTPDLTCISPARVARSEMGWSDVPMMCAQEPTIEGLPKRCIRVLIQFERNHPVERAQPVYLNDATALRPDLFG